MSFLLDTNVVSEWVKPRPEPKVVEWLLNVDEDRVYLSVASFAEIRRGVEIMPAGRRRDLLDNWLTDDLPDRFQGRILSIDQQIANRWGVLIARGQDAGVTLGSMDAFFAATADVHGYTLVTRNVRDFGKLGLSIVDPWSD